MVTHLANNFTIVHQGKVYEFRKTPENTYEVREPGKKWDGGSRHHGLNIIDNINRGTWVSYKPCNLAAQIEKMKGYSSELLGV
jgi:hypothetical protein